MCSPAPLDNFLSRLEHFTTDTPTKPALSFLSSATNINESYTYSQLSSATSNLASHLLNLCKIPPGNKVLLVYAPSLQFLVAFIACLKADLVAVPVFPPDPRKLKKDMYMFASIANDSGATHALTHSFYDHMKKAVGVKNFFTSANAAAKWPELTWIVTDKLKKGGNIMDATFAPPTPTNLAFLQYTSGSTSEPKGVMISHCNLSHNLTIITSELKADAATVVVSWLPQYHDMGLIGSYLGALYCGGSGYYFSPLSFIQNPCSWIEAISKVSERSERALRQNECEVTNKLLSFCSSQYGGTHLQAPNFAYRLCERKWSRSKYEKREGKDRIDLSSVKHMINAAEPVDQGEREITMHGYLHY